MDLSFSPEDEAFRREVREFLARAIPEEIAAKIRTGQPFSHDERMRWQGILHEQGWVAPHWPKKYGGAELPLTRRHILSEELALAGVPAPLPFGLMMLGPILIEFGTEAQKARFLPKILSGEEVWCQGYSEPNAGSDLASLQLSARSDGDFYVLDGQKTWTSEGHYADWIFCLVRTDASGKKQEGITFLLVDIRNTPGVEVRPFMNISGETTFCDTFFVNARVPKENRVGPEGGGWTVAKALLGHERAGIASVAESKRAIAMVERLARRTMAAGRPLAEERSFRRRLAELEVRLKALEVTNLRALAPAAGGGHASGVAPSVLKVRGSELQQLIMELAMDVMGHDAMGWIDSGDEALPPEEQWIASRFNFLRASTIYAGSNEIQRNIIAKMVLGLPS